MASWYLLAGAATGLWFTMQAVRPVPLPARRAIPSFLAGWLSNELVVHHVAWQAVAVVAFARAGALSAWPGWVALVLVLGQWALAWRLWRAARRTPAVMERAVEEALGPAYRAGLPDTPAGWDAVRWTPVVVPLRPGHRDVGRRRDVHHARVGGQDLHLDVFASSFAPPLDPSFARPALVHLHGGAWTLGFRDRQGIPLLVEAARRGFVGIQPSYRLSPLATFPDHLVDAKRAVAWVREHATELGVDPRFVAVAGGSAGGHLAALVALTHDRPDLQPGFEDADTSVQACVPLYGVYDPTNVLGRQPEEMTDFLTRWVVKADRDEAPGRWATASPLAQVRRDAPPFLVVHGARDTLTSPQEAGDFADRLARDAEVGFALLPGAQHAFDLFPSLRTSHTVLGVLRFLAGCHARAGGRQAVPAGGLAQGAS